jgi:mono/diheme cytochrome c family protein
MSDDEAGREGRERRQPRKHSRLARLAGVGAVLVVLAIVVFAALAYRPSIAEIATPAASSFSPAVVAQGARLGSAGYCSSCHSVEGGQPYGGGYAMKTGFGTIYSTNISPDRETGIGTWSEAAFDRALREGVSRDGSHLFPALPYDHFTKLSDGDVAALYAFFMTRPAVHAPAHPDEMPFPLGFRPFQAGWKLLFFQAGRFVPSPDHDATWNRGAYLAESLSHCSACHTPRGLLGAEKQSAKYAGAPVDGWYAPPLTPANPSPVPWTSDELAAYLLHGVSRYHGTAAGPMSPASQGLAGLTPQDQHALVTFIASITQGDAHAAAIAPAVVSALAADHGDAGRHFDPDQRLFVTACASCHYNSGDQPNASRPDLGLNSAVQLSDPSNLIRVILYGIGSKEGAPGIVMPAFGTGFSDDDVVRLAAYLRRTRTHLPAWTDLPKKVREIRAAGKGQL